MSKPRHFHKRTTPKVKSGKVQKKDRHAYTARQGYVIDRESPGKGYTHVVTKQDLRDFLDLLPDRDELLHGVERIMLERGGRGADGSYVRRVIVITKIAES